MENHNRKFSGIMMKKVSVIIPTYRRPEILNRAIQSVLNQTYKNFEILVVNDDHEENQVKNVISNLNDSRIKYYRNQRKKGGNGARNTGILNAEGDYIAFLDDDDEYCPERLLETIKFLNNSDYFGCCTNYYYNIEKKHYKVPKLKCDFNLYNFLLHKVKLCFGSNLVLRKNENIERLFWDEEFEFNQDIEFIIRLLSKYSFGYLPKRLLIVNGHNKIQTAKKVEIAVKQLFIKINQFTKHLDKKVMRVYYAKEYRRLALLYGYENNFKKMFQYLFKSIRIRILSPEKYMRFIFIIINFLFKVDLNSKWSQIKFRIISKL